MQSQLKTKLNKSQFGVYFLSFIYYDQIKAKYNQKDFICSQRYFSSEEESVQTPSL